MKLTLFEILALLATTMGVIASGIALYRKKKAENSVETLLKKRKIIMESLINDTVRALSSSQTNLSAEEFRKVREVLIDLLEEMDVSEKEKILESLQQKSMKGQVDYLNKLIQLSGSTQTVNVV